MLVCYRLNEDDLIIFIFRSHFSYLFSPGRVSGRMDGLRVDHSNSVSLEREGSMIRPAYVKWRSLL